MATLLLRALDQPAETKTISYAPATTDGRLVVPGVVQDSGRWWRVERIDGYDTLHDCMPIAANNPPPWVTGSISAFGTIGGGQDNGEGNLPSE
jgi:hypothetical protein